MVHAAVAALVALAASPEDAVRAADAALDRAAGARDTAAFVRLLEDDVLFAGGRRVSRGRAAVLEAWAPFFAAGGPSLRWAPARAVVAASRDVAVTTGRWALEAAGDGGEVARSEGEYVTVWRRAPDGAWRVALDASLEPAARLGAGLARTPLRTVTSAAGDLEATLGTWVREAKGDEGAYVEVRRRAAGGGWTVAVDSAFAFPPPKRAN